MLTGTFTSVFNIIIILFGSVSKFLFLNKKASPIFSFGLKLFSCFSFFFYRFSLYCDPLNFIFFTSKENLLTSKSPRIKFTKHIRYIKNKEKLTIYNKIL